MRHGCSAHVVKSALNGTLGLSASRAGAIDFDALWVTPWQACSDAYPTSLTTHGNFGEIRWQNGWPSRATIFVEARGRVMGSGMRNDCHDAVTVVITPRTAHARSLRHARFIRAILTIVQAWHREQHVF